MSKNDMVMVSRDLGEAILGNASQGYFSKDHGDALRAALKAQQNQGEPVALPARKREFTDSGTALLQNLSWNACLDEIAKLGPLYTHADPAEVEQLRIERDTLRSQLNALEELSRDDEVERLQRRIQNAELALKAQTQNCDTMRAQLAEAQAENERLKQGFYQKVTDADLKKISDYVGDPGLPTGAFLRQDAYYLANFTEHMCREVQASRIKLAEAQALLRDKSGDLIRMAAHLISAPLFALQDLQDEDKRMTRARVDHAVDVADARLKDAAYELRRISNALSASAEPSAPECRKCGSACTHEDDAYDECRFCNAGMPSSPDDAGAALARKP